MAILCEGLATNTSVTAIDLPDNNISVSDAHFRARRHRCPALHMRVSRDSAPTALSVSSWPPVPGSAAPRVCRERRRDKPHTCTLVVVVVVVVVQDAACCMLAEAVKHNTSLTQLQLASNQISDNGATALAQVRHARPPLSWSVPGAAACTPTPGRLALRRTRGPCGVCSMCRS